MNLIWKFLDFFQVMNLCEKIVSKYGNILTKIWTKVPQIPKKIARSARAIEESTPKKTTSKNQKSSKNSRFKVFFGGENRP